MQDASASSDAKSRGRIVRDVLIFQVKLWLEGFKDVVLMPLSLGAAVIDLVFRGRKTPDTLHSVMRLGDRFERWVHLYAALEKGEKRTARENSLDDLLNEAADGIEKQAPNGRTERTDANRSRS